MAKKQIIRCMFCEEIPCQCGTKSPAKSETIPEKKKPVFKIGPSPSFTSTPPPFVTNHSVELFEKSHHNSFKGKMELQEVEAKDPEQLEWVATLRVLWPILSAQTKLKYRDLVEPTLSPEMYRRRGAIRGWTHE